MRAHPPGGRSLLAFLLVGVTLVLLAFGGACPVEAAPGLCVGPVCGDGFERSPTYPWQMRMRIQDQWGHRERLVVDCRDGSISPMLGPVERGYAMAVARRGCRQAPLNPMGHPQRPDSSLPPKA